MRFIKTRNGSGPTRFLYVSGAGSSLGTSEDTIRDAFSAYGIPDVVLVEDKRFCYIVYQDIESAVNATNNLQNKIIPEFGSNSPIQIRYADLEISQLDFQNNDEKNHKNENNKNEVNQGLSQTNMNIILKKLNIKDNKINSSINNLPNLSSFSDFEGLKFNSYYVNPEPVCSSSTDHIDVPGCEIVKDFITPEEEKNILQNIENDENAPWEKDLTRRVKHYGFPFNYRTLMLDYARETSPLTAECRELAQRMLSLAGNVPQNLPENVAENFPIKEDVPQENSKNVLGNCVGTEGLSPSSALTQLTVNEYLPGQGIAQHIDTESCFGPDIFIINMGCDIVMTLQQQKRSNGDNIGDNFNNGDNNGDTDGDNNGDNINNEEEELNAENNSKNDKNEDKKESKSNKDAVRKYLHLPARSLLILRHDARYLWSHGIAPRTTDKVDGVLVSRGTRISLTFRQALIPGSLPSSSLASSDLEKDHVFRVYDNIAVHWNHTRGKRKVHWPRIKSFIDDLPKGSLLADIGSGDGKYFGVNPDIFYIGCDRSLKLLQVSHDSDTDTFCCDAVKLPLRTSSFDATICIAVFHHLATVDRRSAVIRELLRITVPGGFVMIHAWAKEQGEDSKHNFPESDMMVPWRLQKRFFQAGQSVSTPVQEKEEIKIKKIKKKGRLPKKGKVNCPPESVWRDVADDTGGEGGEGENGEKGGKGGKGVYLNENELENWNEEGEIEDEDVIGDRSIAETVEIDGRDENTNEKIEVIGKHAETTGNEVEKDVEKEVETVQKEVETTGKEVETTGKEVETTGKEVDVEEEVSPEGRCEHMKEDGDHLLFQRYCHVYQAGELEDLCSCIPNCRIIETGWDKGNWTVLLEKISDSRLTPGLSQIGPESATPILHVRK